MAAKNEIIFKNDTIQLSKGADGFWLYDYIQQMNLCMRAKTEQEAFIKAIEYYQVRLTAVKSDYKKLHNIASLFVSSFLEDEDN